MAQAGFPAAPADAVAEVRQYAALVTEAEGGRGAVREMVEFLLKAQGRWEDVVARFLSPERLENISQ